MERSKIPLNKWAVTIYLHLSNLKGASSVKLARDLKISQGSCWFLLHRIPEAFKSEHPIKMTGPVELDESYFGGLEKNKHKDKKLNAGRGFRTFRTIYEKGAVVPASSRGCLTPGAARRKSPRLGRVLGYRP